MAKDKWTVYDYALYYVKVLGFSVIPVNRKTKRPKLDSWKEFQSKKPSKDQLELWFKDKNNNIGIVTGKISGITVVDFDSEATFEKLKYELHLQNVPTVRTAKGYHCYFLYKEGLKNQTKINGLSIDLRGDGGYVVAPPSIHESGVLYQWINEIDSDRKNLKPLPEFFRSKKKVIINKNYDRPVSEGNRNSALTSKVGYWFKKGLSFDDCFTEAKKWDSEFCKPPLEDKEVEIIVKSIAKKENEKTKTSNSKTQKESEKFNPVDLANEIMDDIPLMVNNGLLYYYNDNRGLYLANSEDYLKGEIRQRLVSDARNNRVKEVYNHIVEIKRKEALSENQTGNSSHIINFKNCMYDPIKHEVLNHDPKYHSTIQIPTIYDPKAKGLKTPDFFNSVFSKDEIPFIEELIGYCLFPKIHLEKAFFLFGKGGNGKSTFINLLTALFGKESISRVPAKELIENKFALADLENKLINIDSELIVIHFNKLEKLKSIISGDEIKAERKYRDPFNFKPVCILIFATNELPKISLVNESNKRRYYVIPFKNTFDESNKDISLIVKLTSEQEKSGLLNIAIEGLKRLQANKRFTEGKTIKVATGILFRENKSVDCFIEDCLEASSDSILSRTQLRKSYSEYCHKNIFPKATPKELYNGIKKSFKIQITREANERYFAGIKLKGI